MTDPAAVWGRGTWPNDTRPDPAWCQHARPAKHLPGQDSRLAPGCRVAGCPFARCTAEFSRTRSRRPRRRRRPRRQRRRSALAARAAHAGATLAAGSLAKGHPLDIRAEVQYSTDPIRSDSQLAADAGCGVGTYRAVGFAGQERGNQSRRTHAVRDTKNWTCTTANASGPDAICSATWFSD